MLLIGFLSWVVAGFLWVVVKGSHILEKFTVESRTVSLGIVEVGIALGVLVVLFLVFVVVQIEYLFGGEEVVRTTFGLSYAEYARSGFFQLVTVAALVVPVLLGAQAILSSENERDWQSFRALATVILILDRSLGIPVYPYLAGVGIIGIAVAFGSQALVKDVVTGIFQLLEGQYAVGDYVQIGTAFGKVEDVGLRVTRLRDFQDKLYFVPNGTITMVTTYDEPSTGYVLQAPIEKADQAEEALEAVKALAVDVRSEYPELVEYVGEPEVVTGESGLTSVKVRLGIVPTQEWIVNTEIPARVKQLLTAREITMPEGRLAACYLDISPLARMPRTEES